MDSNTHTPRTAKFARRALPVFAIAVLTIGLGACQTPRQGDTETTGHKVDTVQAPAGVDLNQPADRIEEQLQREAAAGKAAPNVGSWTDRIIAELEYRANQPRLRME